MAEITVYTKPACVQCNATFRALDREGIASTAIDITEILRLMRHTDSGDYLQAPVAYAGPDNHFCGFRPDRIKALTAAAA